MSCVAEENRRAKFPRPPSSPLPQQRSSRSRICCRRKLIRPELDNLRANYPRTAHRAMVHESGSQCSCQLADRLGLRDRLRVSFGADR
jgi:hypothetical protein